MANSWRSITFSERFLVPELPFGGVGESGCESEVVQLFVSHELTRVRWSIPREAQLRHVHVQKVVHERAFRVGFQALVK